jgi:axial budding pattern protein 2
MVMIPIILVAAALLPAATAKVSVKTPIAGQLPLVARVDAPYNWSLAPSTFVSSTGQQPTVSVFDLPLWLSFDSDTLSFHGQPSASDKGETSIKVSASDTKSSASSTFTLLVKAVAAPTLFKPFAPQFLPNPSLSSVFQLHNGSALATSNPALRVPPLWSFSIGFDGQTFQGPNSVFYEALLVDGSPLPPWIRFSPHDITFGGIAPATPSPMTIPLALIVTDSKGYRTSTLPFDLFVAAHELSMDSSSLPTINVTAQAAFNVSITSPTDFAGVLLDGTALNPADLSLVALAIPSASSWLSFDNATRTLSGTPPPDFRGKLTLPVALTAADNETMQTTVSLDVAPPYFINETIPAITVDVGHDVRYDLTTDFSAPHGSVDVTLGAMVDANGADSSFLTFDAKSGTLSGTIPADFTETSIAVTFVAYSESTHSTSHASLAIHIPDARPKPAADQTHHLASDKARRVVAIVSAILCAILFVCLFLAVIRWYARAPDSAETGVASVRGYSVEDKRWYGLDADGRELGLPTDEKAPAGMLPVVAAIAPATGVRKADFVAKLRAGAKAVTDTVRSVSGSTPRVRPAISRPILKDVPGDIESGSQGTDGFEIISYATSDATSRHSASSTGERSLPHRRADFMPPQPSSLKRSVSAASGGSRSTCSDVSEEAVVQTASRARSVRSIQRLSNGSAATMPTPSTPAVPKAARLVPFDAETPVPRAHTQTPRVQSPLGPAPAPLVRMSSQRAVVVERGTMDDLALGATYVRALGEDPERLSGTASETATMRSPRCSVGSYSLASSKYTARDRRDEAPRVLGRIGERFKIRMTVTPGSGPVLVRLVSGRDLPRFIDGSIGDTHVEMWGVPGAQDAGEYDLVAIDCETGLRLGTATLEVVNRI